MTTLRESGRGLQVVLGVTLPVISGLLVYQGLSWWHGYGAGLQPLYAGPGSGSPPAAQSQVSKPQARGITAVIQEVQASVVYVGVSNRWGEGSGSGFIFNRDGHVMTNAHVVKDATKITVKDADGNEYKAELVGTADDADVALLLVPELRGRVPLPLGSAIATQGDDVLAFGSPFGIQNTVTRGMISGVGRSLTVSGTVYHGLIQTTTPISPGNSGGPLVDTNTGQVIGINTLATDPRVARVIGFAIPIQQAVQIAAGWGSHP